MLEATIGVGHANVIHEATLKIWLRLMSIFFGAIGGRFLILKIMFMFQTHHLPKACLPTSFRCRLCLILETLIVAPQTLHHLSLLTATADLVVNLPIVTLPTTQGLVVEFVWISAQHDTALALLDGL